ncbi:MAG: hypothetical protein F4Z21_07955 [Acidobacteria bacterium]|nr:hypothetical protein [Acidobacteriota bacterium]
MNELEPIPTGVAGGQDRPHPVSMQADVLKEFLRAIGRKKRAVLLDIGVPTGANVEFFFGREVKLYVEDLLDAYSKPEYSTSFNDQRAQVVSKFFRENFKYPVDFFDGLICWDLLSYLDPEFASLFVARVSAMMKSKSLIFALFQTRPSGGSKRIHQYRIVTEANLERTPTDRAMSIRKLYQNRDVTQLFDGFETRRFLLMKQNLLAVIMQKY